MLIKETLKLAGTIVGFILTVVIFSGFYSVQTSTQVKFCQKTNYGGQCFIVSKGGGNTDLTKKAFPGGGNWNDSISSIQVGDNVRAKAFENTNWTGECITFSGKNVGGGSNGSYPNLSDYEMYNGKSWNDQITSFKVGGSELSCQ